MTFSRRSNFKLKFGREVHNRVMFLLDNYLSNQAKGRITNLEKKSIK